MTSTGLPRTRGKSKKSLDLIEAAVVYLEEANPTTVRGVCYRLFVDGIIPDMSRSSTARVSRLLTDAREDGTIPWEWVVDETRELKRTPSWSDPAEYVEVVRRSYRRDFWADQPYKVEVWSEKGTVRGVLQPVLNEFGVGVRVMHGFGSATSVYDVAQSGDEDLPLIALYVGDHDPSGLYMSEKDLPERLGRYGGDHVLVHRVALLPTDTLTLPSFPAASKRGDPRYRWFTERYGDQCCELDAMDPNVLRNRVRASIIEEIESEAWARCMVAQEAETESLSGILDAWSAR